MPNDPQTPSEIEALITAQLTELSDTRVADQFRPLLTTILEQLVQIQLITESLKELVYGCRD